MSARAAQAEKPGQTDESPGSDLELTGRAAHYRVLEISLPAMLEVPSR